MDRYQPEILGRTALALVVVFAIIACAGGGSGPATSSVATVEGAPSTSVPDSTPPAGSSDLAEPALPYWATSTVVEMDPVTLEARGPAFPAGLWTEGSVVTGDLIALATWPLEETERADARWRLLVASRKSGEILFDERAGDMNVLGMFHASSDEVMIVEPIRSADWNFADGFVVHAYDAAAGQLREAARFEDGDFQPNLLTLLSDGRLGLVGTERNGDAFDRRRIVIFDWRTNETVVDVILDDLRLDADAPDGVWVESMQHPVVWDEARDRVLVVHAHEDVITTVSMADGSLEQVRLDRDESMLSGLLAWLFPPARAKGLPSVQRHAVISGDHLYVAGETVTFESETDGSHSYRIAPTEFLKIDLETLRIERSAELGASFVAGAPSGGYLIGGGHVMAGRVNLESTTVASEEYTGLLVIDPDTLEVIERHDEANITYRYDVQVSSAGDLIYVHGSNGGILTFDPRSGELETSGQAGPFEPELLRNSLRYESHSN